MKLTASHNTTLLRRLADRLGSEEQGHGLLEMALVLLFLLPLTFGMIDTGRCLYTQSVVRAAAQEGARAGIIDTQAIHETIERKLIGLDMAQAAVEVDTSQADIVSVSITYDFVFVTPMLDSFLSTLSLHASASMVAM